MFLARPSSRPFSELTSPPLPPLPVRLPRLPRGPFRVVLPPSIRPCLRPIRESTHTPPATATPSNACFGPLVIISAWSTPVFGAPIIVMFWRAYHRDHFLSSPPPPSSSSRSVASSATGSVSPSDLSHGPQRVNPKRATKEVAKVKVAVHTRQLKTSESCDTVKDEKRRSQGFQQRPAGQKVIHSSLPFLVWHVQFPPPMH